MSLRYKHLINATLLAYKKNATLLDMIPIDIYIYIYMNSINLIFMLANF